MHKSHQMTIQTLLTAQTEVATTLKILFETVPVVVKRLDWHGNCKINVRVVNQIHLRIVTKYSCHNGLLFRTSSGYSRGYLRFHQPRVADGEVHTVSTNTNLPHAP
jgi:hypothetical protein